MKAQAGQLSAIRSDAAGIDVGSEQNFVCAPASDEAGMTEVLVAGATTAELLKIADWLQARKVRTVALESTGGARRRSGDQAAGRRASQ